MEGNGGGTWRRWVKGLALSMGIFASGCLPLSSFVETSPGGRATASVGQNPPAVLQLPESIPVSQKADPARKVPISLDAVLRLAQDKNGHIAIGREKLQEAY